jgi:hypothetical protein
MSAPTLMVGATHSQVAINDTYHQKLWCRRRDMRKVNETYRRDFPAQTSDLAVRNTGCPEGVCDHRGHTRPPFPSVTQTIALFLPKPLNCGVLDVSEAVQCAQAM